MSVLRGVAQLADPGVRGRRIATPFRREIYGLAGGSAVIALPGAAPSTT